MKTRSQQYSQQVFEQLSQLNFEQEIRRKAQPKVLTANEVSTKSAELAKQYGSLCHQFPLMVLRNGLAQAVAFVWVKSKNDESSPQGLFLQHLSELTSGATGESPAAFQQRINALDLAQYQRITRKILAASIWYKRFAESLLGVSGDNNDD